MEGLFFVFLILALLGRVIEAMARGPQGKGRTPPPARRPRPQYERPHGTTRPAPYDALPGRRLPPDGVPRDATADAAAEMIPDELWEIITGQPKPRRAPPVLWDDEADLEEAAATADTALPDEVDAWEARQRAEDEARRKEQRALMERRRREEEAHTADKAPPVVSLERPLPAALARHAAFHQELATPAPAAPARRRPAPQGPRARLFAGGDLRRAFVLQEVFGRPKGLD